MIKTLKVFGTGQITIPKEIREKYKTSHFRLSESEDGILLEPVKVTEEVVFEEPISAKELSKSLKKIIKQENGQ